ncbi:TNF receptor-associated factor 2-like [Lingula anatina]|uniref:TNF receptor-associated factor 2-like n=1 Tax=Lingula anatina TaxID=7574 RepID=A0A1S3KBI9_LINAN|nr:TNF receptor-associated factor 2-like [Lingula anatina]|eukprot:XP_013420003.1 TNF receptor-associated factor 2-like [Lingula anatina]
MVSPPQNIGFLQQITHQTKTVGNFAVMMKSGSPLKSPLVDGIRYQLRMLGSVTPELLELGQPSIFPDNAMRLELNLLKIVCDQNGCIWTGRLQDYQEIHEKSCRTRQSTIPDAELREGSDRGAERHEQTIFMKDGLRPPDLKKQIHVPECFRKEEEKLLTTFKRMTVSASEELDNKFGLLDWKITDFFRKRQDSISGRLTSLDSPSFYTSPRGYKMCCRIFLNGSETGKGTHVSIYFVLMPGQFDDQLDWPFGQSMSISLVDQKDTDPADITNKFIPDPSISKRPMSDMQVVAGDPKFVSLRELYGHTKTTYVKDDVMVIRATVD